ncbi:MAG: proteasome-activating nucleotidase [Nanoarchaeota archaeon]|nr:proteasome-activating nucleotidase [Nanoarchaeota archaeon]MBU1622291.1 proteasome-activating nucleotidase [Nanoarchaeota archaeon]MBU1973937.1 proteasome-activating nucleotidase [Nanoarchaeota archaeon]
MTTKDDIVYSETFAVDDLESKYKHLTTALTKLETENKSIYQNLRRVEEESTTLKHMFEQASSELENMRKPSLLVAEVVSILNNNKAVIKLPNGNQFCSYFSKEIAQLKKEDTVLVEQKSLNVVEKINLATNFDVEKFVIVEKPTESWKEIGGLKDEIREIIEVIELPLKKPHLFEKVGINPPKGVLLHGPPGTGKTLLAKAVANSTQATFIEVVGSELVQKFIGEGAKLVKEIFSMARKKAPSIVFIDEIDALAARRLETGTSGEREVNRTFMQLLAELDGFEHLGDVKIIGATNRIDILDSAVIRPGRLDRLIEVGLPDQEGVREILKVHTRRMNLQKVKIKELVSEMVDFSGAEIRAVCTEAGYFAIRENRDYVTQDDFLQAIEKVRIEEEDDGEEQFFG